MQTLCCRACGTPVWESAPLFREAARRFEGSRRRAWGRQHPWLGEVPHRRSSVAVFEGRKSLRWTEKQREKDRFGAPFQIESSCGQKSSGAVLYLMDARNAG